MKLENCISSFQQDWDGANIVSSKASSHLSCIVNTVVADDLEMQDATALAAMVLTLHSN